MKIIRSDLTWAADQGIITTTQAKSLWDALTKKYEHQPRFTFGHVLYYLGALIVISSMSWFMVTAWESLGGGGVFLVSACYAVCFCIAGRNLWQKPALRIPGGLLFTTAVWMTPLVVYGFQRMMGWWPTPVRRKALEWLMNSDDNESICQKHIGPSSGNN